MSIYDVNGNEIVTASGVGITNLDRFNDNSGVARQGILTQGENRLYPFVYPSQIVDKIKVYNGGLLLALGDSYTAMANSQFMSFATTHGLVLDNLGLASSTIAGSADSITVGYHPFWVRLDSEIDAFPKTINGTEYQLSDVKLITFMGGANDWWTVDGTVDRLGDPTSTNKEQLYGACKYIFERLYNVCPNADIIVILQPSNANGASNNYPMWLKESIVRDCAEMYGLPICDCIFDWFNPTNPSDLAKYWQSDKLHLTTDGNTALFKKLEHTLNTLQFYRAS